MTYVVEKILSREWGWDLNSGTQVLVHKHVNLMNRLQMIKYSIVYRVLGQDKITEPIHDGMN